MTRLLVLGGSDFVGRAVVDDALARGWDVTVLNRGSTPVPDGVRQLVGDRTRADGLDALRAPGAHDAWDAVVDTWSWAPAAVRDAARLLADRIPDDGRYVYVSSRSVYPFPPARGADESAALVDGDPDDTTHDDYARAKRGAEIAAVEALGDRAILLRAGLILGPRENVGRLPWWLRRVVRGGPVLAPGPADLPLQYVDARDLAAFALDVSTNPARASGPVDVVSAPGHTTMGGLLAACVAVTADDAAAAGNPPAELVWVEPEVVLAAGIEPWSQLPVWLPPGELHDALHGSDTSLAYELGLRPRDVRETVRDTWTWLRALDAAGEATPQRADRPAVGLPPDLEAAALAAAATG
ncbi:NAD-dependent epimerase/dehydratase family protein [Cellulosimicrobium protaetiae]|uniref:NAD-dependent epimerase/dehydratase family protein n=1 Tax=Cellulosimicrobium protaetiae TaxID=2587808 RepID=A0A6M5UE53_9MICO|nr:NAD-dependent epimerase/dehydratase family protein [Cellulosimicrobium protaetiae]QJW35358.1 NAD-dependent epimerase/dehydratase family protein [Cellulosimicrobium protaetiae]